MVGSVDPLMTCSGAQRATLANDVVDQRAWHVSPLIDLVFAYEDQVDGTPRPRSERRKRTNSALRSRTPGWITRRSRSESIHPRPSACEPNRITVAGEVAVAARRRAGVLNHSFGRHRSKLSHRTSAILASAARARVSASSSTWSIYPHASAGGVPWGVDNEMLCGPVRWSGGRRPIQTATRVALTCRWLAWALHGGALVHRGQ